MFTCIYILRSSPEEVDVNLLPKTPLTKVTELGIKIKIRQFDRGRERRVRQALLPKWCSVSRRITGDL